MGRVRVLAYTMSLDGFEGLAARAQGYECEKSVAGERATHLFLRRTPG